VAGEGYSILGQDFCVNGWYVTGYSILGQDFCVNGWYVTGIFEKFPIVMLGELPEKLQFYTEHESWTLFRNISNALPVITA
jgi:hypothetical protein